MHSVLQCEVSVLALQPEDLVPFPACLYEICMFCPLQVLWFPPQVQKHEGLGFCSSRLE